LWFRREEKMLVIVDWAMLGLKHGVQTRSGRIQPSLQGPRLHHRCISECASGSAYIVSAFRVLPFAFCSCKHELWFANLCGVGSLHYDAAGI
jgi:hypothetical protein